jgi:hypothetical protein
MNTQSGGFEDWVAGLVTRGLKGVVGTVQGNVRGGEYVGYDSSINTESYGVSGSRDVRRASKQGNDVRLGTMISWPREQLAQESFTLGRSWAELPRGYCTMFCDVGIRSQS